MTDDLRRLVPLDRLPGQVLVEASAEERAALAVRLHIPAVLSMHCRFQLRREGDVVVADGALTARVVQACVVSLDDVEQSVEERFALRFVPEGQDLHDEDPETPDELPYAGGRIDLGEAAAEQLALALDPYPRHPDAVLDPAAEDGLVVPLTGLGALRRLQ